MKLPRKEALPDSQEARREAWFWFGLAGALLCLLVLLAFLARGREQSFCPGVLIGWLLLVVWPLGIGLRQWQRYRQARELEREHLIVLGQVVGFARHDLADCAVAPTDYVYWIIFTVHAGAPIKQRVSWETYQRLKVGDKLEVKVASHDQNLCRAEVM